MNMNTIENDIETDEDAFVYNSKTRRALARAIDRHRKRERQFAGETKAQRFLRMRAKRANLDRIIRRLAKARMLEA